MVNSNQPPTKRAKSDKSSQGNSRSQDPQRSSSKPIQKHSNDTSPDEASDNSSEEIMGKGSDVENDNEGEIDERERGEDDREDYFRRELQTSPSHPPRQESPRDSPQKNIHLELQYSKIVDTFPKVENINEVGALSSLIDRLIGLATTCPNILARQLES